MSRQIRRNELHRRQVRREGLKKLRARYAKAKTNSEKEQIIQKVARVAPCISSEQFLATLQAP